MRMADATAWTFTLPAPLTQLTCSWRMRRLIPKWHPETHLEKHFRGHRRWSNPSCDGDGLAAMDSDGKGKSERGPTLHCPLSLIESQFRCDFRKLVGNQKKASFVEVNRKQVQPVSLHTR